MPTNLNSQTRVVRCFPPPQAATPTSEPGCGVGSIEGRASIQCVQTYCVERLTQTGMLSANIQVLQEPGQRRRTEEHHLQMPPTRRRPRPSAAHCQPGRQEEDSAKDLCCERHCVQHEV